MAAKQYSIERLNDLRKALSKRFATGGIIKSLEALRIANTAGILLSNSALRNIFRLIMDDMVAKGKARYMCAGRWELINQVESIDVAKEISYSFLDPPVYYPEQSMYVELRTACRCGKDFNEQVIKLCDHYNISVERFLNYINERHSKRIGTKGVQSQN